MNPEAPTRSAARAGSRALWLLLLFTAVATALSFPSSASATTPPVGAEADSGFKGTITYTTPDPDNAGRTMKLPIENAVVNVYALVDGERGELVGSATSNAEGQWELAVASGAAYEIELDESSLPEGVTLTRAGDNVRSITAERNRVKSTIFALADEDGAAATQASRRTFAVWERVLRVAYQGLEFGLIIGMCAIGLSLIFATTGLVNFAHAEMITIGAVGAWYLNTGLDLHLLLVIPIAVVLGGALGAGFDRALWRPLRQRGTGLVAMMIVSIGLSIGLRYVVLYIFGDRREAYAQYQVQRKPLFTLGPIEVLPKDFVIIVTSTLILLGVASVLRYTKLGKAMRAVSDNPDLAASTGIDVNRTVTTVWFMAGALVTLGAIFQGIAEGAVNWMLGNSLLLLVFAAVTLGGLGTAYGAMVGSIILGVLANLTTVPFAPEWKNVGALAVMIVLLMVRPQGLFGRRERIG